MKRYLPSVKQYSWVILVSIVIATLMGLVLAKQTPSSYQVNSIMLVSIGAPGTTMPGASPSGTSIEQAYGYSSEIMSRKVMEYVFQQNATALSARHYTADDLLVDVTTSVATTSPIITVTAIAPNPADAVLIANAVTSGFEDYITKQAQSALTTQRGILQNQLQTDNTQKNNDQKTMQQIANTTDQRYIFASSDLSFVNQQINALQTQLDQLPVTIKGNVAVIQQAKLIDVSQSSKTIIVVAAASGVGLLFGILVLLLLIFLDDRLRGGDLVKEKLGLAYVGGLVSDKSIQSSPARLTGQAAQQISDIAVNLRLTGVLPAEWAATRSAVLLVTSSQEAEGKTSLAIALAATVAHSGSTVLVIDGNLRKPATHLAFGMSPGGMGLSGLLKGTGRELVDDAVQRSNVPGVWLLPAGTPMDEAALVLGSRLPNILSQLRQKINVVIIDGPSLLDGAEANLIATMVDGVVLVVDARHDKMKLLRRSSEILKSLTNTSAGVILNRAPHQKRNNYYASPLTTNTASGQRNSLPIQSNNGAIDGDGNGKKVEQAPFVSASPAPIVRKSTPSIDMSSQPSYMNGASSVPAIELPQGGSIMPPNPPYPFPPPRNGDSVSPMSR